jgi:hypothetical protein
MSWNLSISADFDPRDSFSPSPDSYGVTKPPPHRSVRGIPTALRLHRRLHCHLHCRDGAGVRW